jgi:transcriptional activator/SIR2-like protein
VTRPRGYMLQVPRDRLDLTRFEDLTRHARAVEPPERAELLRSALSLWRGTPLADFAGDEFAQVEIRRLEELRLAAVEERVEADLLVGHHDELVAELESLVAEYPLRERLRGQLMLALYRSGRQAEALQAYHNARRTLVDDLGIEPSRELQDLNGAILRQERWLKPTAASPAADHLGEVVRALLAGRLVPVLGPGVSLSGRLDGNVKFAPDDAELAARLAESFDCPIDLSGSLARVSQYVAVTKGVGPLYDELHALLDRDYPPGPVHRYLAELPSFLRARGLPQLLIVTTSYDETLEQAFREAGEQFDLVSYVALGRDRGKFLHVAPDGGVRVVEEPNADTSITTNNRTVILKIHGCVDRRPGREWESFVVSEDDYIDYLAHAELANVVPVTLAAKLKRSHFLFLGYGVLDWNLRVFLRRVWGESRVSYRSWSVQPDSTSLAREFWRHRDVDVFDVPLEEYVAELRVRTDDLARAAA